jgi:glyoxylase-like metal-dependent hydrolase (beta-lactamase superfamily II)
MKVLAIDQDVIVFVSAFWQTTCTAVRAGDEGFVIDSPVLPNEHEALPQVLEQSHFPVTGLLATHGDWDHLLGRQAFPDASLGAGEKTAAALAADPTQPQRELDEFDAEHYIERLAPLALENIQALPVPGHLALGTTRRELELHPAPGHTSDGTAYLIPWLGVLVCGDYLSPLEVPWLSSTGSLEAYLETLGRLRDLVPRATTVVPGHGGPISSADAARILEEDEAYLRALQAGQSDVALPDGRDTPFQRQIHGENLGRVS